MREETQDSGRTPVHSPLLTTAIPSIVPRDGTIRNHAAFSWSVADLFRGDYKPSEYGKVILPLTVIRRLDCVLEPTKQAVLDKHSSWRVGPRTWNQSFRWWR